MDGSAAILTHAGVAAVHGPILAAPTGVLISMEGLWGAGKTTVARMLGARIAAHGFTVTVLGYGPQDTAVKQLSELLDGQPLRRREALGGFEQPHHATVDVFLRLARESWHHEHTYAAALAGHDVVVLDHGAWTKIGYQIAVLSEQYPHRGFPELLAGLWQVARPWFRVPDAAFYLDVPWPLARERAIGRGRGGGVPGSVERLMFLPGYDKALRFLAGNAPAPIHRVAVAACGVDDVVDQIEALALAALNPTAAKGAAR